MKTLSTPVSREERHAHDEIAALLSILPGLGHIYKGHYELAFFGCFSEEERARALRRNEARL